MADVKTISTKNNRLMAFVTVEDLYGQMEVVVFPNIYEECSRFLDSDSPIWVEGRINLKEDEQAKILASQIRPLILEFGHTNGDGSHAAKEDAMQYQSDCPDNLPDMNQAVRGKIIKIMFSEDVPEIKRRAVLSLLRYFEGTDRALIYLQNATKPAMKMNTRVDPNVYSGAC